MGQYSNWEIILCYKGAELEAPQSPQGYHTANVNHIILKYLHSVLTIIEASTWTWVNPHAPKGCCQDHGTTISLAFT